MTLSCLFAILYIALYQCSIILLMLFYVTSYCFVLCYVIMFITLYYVLYYIMFRCLLCYCVICCIMYRYVSVYYIVLHCITLRCILHYVKSRFWGEKPDRKRTSSPNISTLENQTSWKYWSYEKVVARKVVQLGAANKGGEVRFR